MLIEKEKELLKLQLKTYKILTSICRNINFHQLIDNNKLYKAITLNVPCDKWGTNFR